jgi:gamma-glutamyl:cysteine ligase YbdK (ATP-grasp superfamily)
VTDGAAEAAATGRPALRVIDAGASPEEVAAIVAAVTAALASAAGAPDADVDASRTSRWVTAARLRARRAGVHRGEWRRSERIGPRVQT